MHWSNILCINVTFKHNIRKFSKKTYNIWFARAARHVTVGPRHSLSFENFGIRVSELDCNVPLQLFFVTNGTLSRNGLNDCRLSMSYVSDCTDINCSLSRFKYEGHGDLLRFSRFFLTPFIFFSDFRVSRIRPPGKFWAISIF